MLEIQIVHETPDWLVIYKPEGYSVQDDVDGPGILNRLKLQLDEPELALVHRLDKVTSGLLLIGRHHQATSILSQQFADRTVEKFYLAVAKGKPAKKQGSIVGDMVKARRGCWKLVRSKNNPAISQFFSVSHSTGLRWYLLKPSTGKTHQLRVALKSLGCPILGDTAYGAESAKRVYLHAYALKFSWQGEGQSFICPPIYSGVFDDSLPKEWQQPFAMSWARVSA